MAQFDKAVQDWCRALGEERVIADAAGLAAYRACTVPVKRAIAVALRPADVQQITDIVSIARRYATPLYPISTGHNWGYGSANPVTDGGVIVDLSEMSAVVSCDPELGLVTVEPGVTQRDLHLYLESNGLPFMVPTTGAGPTCSLIGNALERGYGITPYADHFGAATWLEAVLPDGRIYRGALTELGGVEVDRAHKWGIGPYLDGLFAQGGMGIVTKMTFALARRQTMLPFLFTFSDDALDSAVSSVRETLSTVGGIVGSINLMNASRVQAMSGALGIEQGQARGKGLRTRAAAQWSGDWTGIGALYCPKEMAPAARSTVQSLLKQCADVRFVSPRLCRGTYRMMSALPFSRRLKLAAAAGRVVELLRLMDGIPSELALNLPYSKSGRRPPEGTDLNPGRDGCGLTWYAPLVPMKAPVVREYVGMVTDICLAHGFDPLITLTSLSNRCFDSTVPLLYDPSDAAQSERARSCYLELYEAGKARGILPYRIGIDSMDLIRRDNPYWDTVEKIKDAVDPQRIIAPGRYSSAEPGP